MTGPAPKSLGERLRGQVVLLHDWLTGLRGGERVLEAFCDLFPGAPIYTLLHHPGSTSPKIEERRIQGSLLNRLPGIARYYRRLLPLMPAATDLMAIREQPRLVLSSHHCTIKGVKKPRGAVHVSYVHSPMRYMYDQYEHYFGAGTSRLTRLGGMAFRRYLTGWDRSTNANVDLMIANSAFVQQRIRRFYGCDAAVVHPFVELADFAQVQRQPPARDEHFAMVTAFAPNKRVDLAIAAFNQLKLPLVIVGGGQLEAQLRSQAGPTIKFLGSIDRAGVIDVLARAQGFVFPGVEDFGITPLEALAAGTPVIAYRAGGVLETLTEEDTVFFDEPTVDSLVGAVRQLQANPRRPDPRRLQRFSRQRFLDEMTAAIEGALARA